MPAQIFYKAKFSLKKTQYHLGIIRLSLWTRRVLGLALLNLPPADDGISVKGELPPLPNGCPTLGMMGPVLLASVCMGKRPPMWQHSSSLHSPRCAPAFSTSSMVWSSLEEKEGCCALGWEGVLALMEKPCELVWHHSAGSNISSLPAFPNVHVAVCHRILSPCSLLLQLLISVPVPEEL